MNEPSTTKKKSETAATPAPTPAAASTATAPASTEAKPAAAEDMIEFSSGFVRPDGFWQNPKPGEVVRGILLARRDAGPKVKQPYFVFELTAPFARMTQRIDESKPGSKQNQREVPAKVGQMLGVKESYNLRPIARKVGYEIWIRFNEMVPTAAGNTVAKFDIKVSKTLRKEIEVMHSPEQAAQGHDEDGGDEIPF
jgi:hypothetical protein